MSDATATWRCCANCFAYRPMDDEQQRRCGQGGGWCCYIAPMSVAPGVFQPRRVERPIHHVCSAHEYVAEREARAS